MNAMYNVIGISKQAVAQYARRQQEFDRKVELLLREAELLRAEHPGCGVEKMYYTLQPDFIGRDRFVELFMELGFRLKRKKNYIKTTTASKIYYPNLIEGMLVNNASVLWQSDITYIRVGECFYYAVFVIDVYTKEIVGHYVSNSLRAEANVKALQKALKMYPPPLIHHSDKGSQYIYKNYTRILKKLNCHISMGETALDNAYAERINLTIKSEYLDFWKPKSLQQLKTMTAKAVKHYNIQRIHNSIDRKTPQEFRAEISTLAPGKRPRVIIYTDRRKTEGGIEPSFGFEEKDLQAPICPIDYLTTKYHIKSVNTI